jgi:hypothetical protein
MRQERISGELRRGPKGRRAPESCCSCNQSRAHGCKEGMLLEDVGNSVDQHGASLSFYVTPMTLLKAELTDVNGVLNGYDFVGCLKLES